MLIILIMFIGTLCGSPLKERRIRNLFYSTGINITSDWAFTSSGELSEIQV